MKITRRQLRRLIKEAIGLTVTYTFPSAVEFSSARKALGDARIPVEFGVNEIMVDSFDVDDVEFTLQNARVRFARQ